jgi:hypothetical protein
MLNLAQLRVRIAIIDEGVEKLQGLPDAHLPFPQWKEFPLFRQHKIERLMAVIEPVEFADSGPDFLAIIAEGIFLFGWNIRGLHRGIPWSMNRIMFSVESRGGFLGVNQPLFK